MPSSSASPSVPLSSVASVPPSSASPSSASSDTAVNIRAGGPPPFAMGRVLKIIVKAGQFPMATFWDFHRSFQRVKHGKGCWWTAQLDVWPMSMTSFSLSIRSSCSFAMSSSFPHCHCIGDRENLVCSCRKHLTSRGGSNFIASSSPSAVVCNRQ